MIHQHPGQRARPEPWDRRRATIRRVWVLPFVWLEHKMDWLAYFLSNWRFLEVLEYLGSLGVLIAVLSYFSESGDRLKQKHYQAWQVIDSAQGKGGNGGRIEALEELNADGVPLVGVDLSSAFLVGVQLPKANLTRADLGGADAREAMMVGATIEDSSLRSANFREANLRSASLQRSVLDDGDLSGAELDQVNLAGASLENTDLSNAELEGAKWDAIKSVKGANIFGVRKAPPAFIEWAKKHGAVETPE